MGGKDRNGGMTDAAAKGFGAGCGAVFGVIFAYLLIAIGVIVVIVLLVRTGQHGLVKAREEARRAVAATSTTTSTLAGLPPAPIIPATSSTTTTTIPVQPAHPVHHGMVVRIVDGDTLMIKIGDKVERVRIRDFDAPEKGDPGFDEATNALSKKFPGGCRVIVTEYARDVYGRLVATVERE